jgi:hypothetical protein
MFDTIPTRMPFRKKMFRKICRRYITIHFVDWGNISSFYK